MQPQLLPQLWNVSLCSILYTPLLDCTIQNRQGLQVLCRQLSSNHQ